MTLEIPRRFLAALDIIIGIVILLFPSVPFFKFLFFLALVKGIMSLLGSIASGFWFDIMGILDIIAAFTLLGIFNGFSLFIFPIVGIAMVIKGLISFV